MMSNLTFTNTKLENKCRENHEGGIEYKFKLIESTRLKMNRLTTQMLYRFIQGDGMAEYYIGVMDDGKVVGLNESELYSTITAILECLDRLGGFYTSILVYNQTDRGINASKKYCIHIKIKIDKLPNTAIGL